MGRKAGPWFFQESPSSFAYNCRDAAQYESGPKWSHPMKRCMWLTVVLIAGWSSMLRARRRPFIRRTSRPTNSGRLEGHFAQIGDHALAIVAGASKPGGFLLPRQSNEFYHLCGIETPNSYLSNLCSNIAIAS